MKIIMADRQTMERGMVVRSSYVVISIADSTAPDARIPMTSGCRDILRMRFDDAEPRPGFRLPPGVQPLQPEDAAKIATFVQQHYEHVGAIVVHCEQGASRSPAVAAAIADHLGMDSRRWWSQYSPNRHVYDLVRATLAAAEIRDG